MTLPPDAPFTLVDLAQDSDEWRMWRKGGIGASDAPTIMGENPWKSPGQLLSEKRRASASTSRLTPAMARGIELEPKARAAYCAMARIGAVPLCVQSSAHDWMRCSLDGMCLEAMRAVEIKCGQAAYRHTVRHLAPPPYYNGQLQHIMAATGLDEIDFFAFLPDQPPVLVTVGRDNGYIEAMIAREAEFWALVSG